MNLEEEIQIMEMKESYSLTGFGKEINEKLAIKSILESNYALSLEEANNQDIEEDEPGQGIEQSEQVPMPGEMTIPGPNASIISEEQMPEPGQANDYSGDEWAPGRKSKVLALGTAVIILIAAIMVVLYTSSGGLTSQLTGQATLTREVQEVTDFNQAFSQATETQLELNNIISFKISGKLEGTSVKVKLRINGTEYLVADIVKPESQQQITGQATADIPQYTIATDKKSYLLGEIVTISIAPDDGNKSLYVSYGEQTQKLETNTYTPEALGEYQAIGLITLPDNILRLETNFTVTSKNDSIFAEPEKQGFSDSNETIAETPEPTPTETSGYEFTALCTETCTMPETTNPILVIETAENSTLTITEITTTQQRENNAPVQVQVIPDLTMVRGETGILDLNEYFSDTDGDVVQDRKSVV
jgi:hypothetical protein